MGLGKILSRRGRGGRAAGALDVSCRWQTLHKQISFNARPILRRRATQARGPTVAGRRPAQSSKGALLVDLLTRRASKGAREARRHEQGTFGRLCWAAPAKVGRRWCSQALHVARGSGGR